MNGALVSCMNLKSRPGCCDRGSSGTRVAADHARKLVLSQAGCGELIDLTGRITKNRFWKCLAGAAVVDGGLAQWGGMSGGMLRALHSTMRFTRAVRFSLAARTFSSAPVGLVGGVLLLVLLSPGRPRFLFLAQALC